MSYEEDPIRNAVIETSPAVPPPSPPPAPPGVDGGPDGPPRGIVVKVVVILAAMTFGAMVATAVNDSSDDVQPTVARTTVTRSVPAVAVRGGSEFKEMFGSGTWLVGRDIAPGTYTTVREVSGTCYWERHTVGGGIIENGVPETGRPTVIVEKGEEFRSRDCGEWRVA